MKQNIVRTTTFAKDAADMILKRAAESFACHGRFVLSLSGGKTPEAVYSALALCGGAIDWKNVFVTFGDERCVGPEHSESNYRMAKHALFDKVNIPSENIHRMHGEDEPQEAAHKYEKEIVALNVSLAGGVMHHDLMLLGLGDDGHTASLFPGTAALNETERLIVANFVPKFNGYRITMTYKLINASRHVCFLVNDPRKEVIVDSILKGTALYPAARVSAVETLTWLLGQ